MLVLAIVFGAPLVLRRRDRGRSGTDSRERGSAG
jgi:hypothetical protein